MQSKRALPDDLTEAVIGSEMMANLREMARWVKLSGTPEEREAFDFLERRMRDYGYRTRLILHDAYISLPGEARVTVDGRPLIAITHSFSLASPQGGLTGVPIYVGAGGADEFARADVRGRIVLIEGMATPLTSRRATDAGAIAQLHISHHEHLHEMCISPVWGSPGTATWGDMPRTVVNTVSNADGIAIRDALAAGRSPLVTLEAKVDTGWRKTPVLECEIDGPSGSDAPFVMLSGHHDTWYYGVMDNGSANAGMLEVARIIAKRRPLLHRGLRVCFWSGHSHGRYSGSAWYADAHWDELERRCVAHVNVDSLGGTGATVLENAAAMTELKHLAAEAIEAIVNRPYKGRRKDRSSDESFVGIGIPSMFGILSEQPQSHARARNALGWWWHTPHDLIDKVDEANLVRDTRVLVHVVWRLLAELIVPLDHAATMDALLHELGVLSPPLEGRFRLTGLVAQAERVKETAIALADRCGGVPPEKAVSVNAALMKVSRVLVPIDYAGGERFLHLPALPALAWATLQPIRDLVDTTAGSDEERFAAVDALRASNRIAFALREALAALEGAHAALGA